MKKQIKKILLSISLFIIPVMNNAAAAQPMPQQAPTNMQMPSVADVFGGMSEDEITKQVQEAQKLFENLSPEEMAEFEKMIEQTIQTMSPQDLEDIAGIAKMVEPHIDVPDENKIPKKPETKSEEKKEEKPAKKETKTDSAETEGIQQLIDNISYQIDDILQKINSDKSLFEELFNKWSSKTTFDNMKRQILTLKQNRLAKKLTAKENQEDKDLVQKLELFYKEIKKLNDVFEVEDSFGASPPKSALDNLIKQTKEILALFDDTIDQLMPILEKFLRKYDPEALQMAKEAEERKKQAQNHAKDAQVRRGSAPAQSAQGQGGPAIRQQPVAGGPTNYPADMGGYPGMYDGYGMPHSGFDYPGYKDFGGSGLDKGTPGAGAKKDEYKQPGKIDTKDRDEAKKKSENAYDDVIETFEEHFAHYNDKKAKDANDFLQKDLAAYPDTQQEATNAKITQANPLAVQDQKEWLASSGKFAAQGGMKRYYDSIEKQMTLVAKEIKNAHKAIANVSGSLSDISEDKLKKIENHNFFNNIKTRNKNYHDFYDKAIQAVNTQYQKNRDKHITDVNELYTYDTMHKDLVSKLNTQLKSQYTSLDEEIDNLQEKVKRTIKRKSSKKKSKAARAVGI